MKKLGLVVLFSAQGLFAAEHPVNIKGFKFTPPILKITAGDTVVFTNEDSFPHSAVPGQSSPGSFEPSGPIPNSVSHSIVFPNPGSIEVKCGVHPTMPGLKIDIQSPEA